MLRGLFEWGNRQGFFFPRTSIWKLTERQQSPMWGLQEVRCSSLAAASIYPQGTFAHRQTTAAKGTSLLLHWREGRKGFKQPALCPSSLKNSGVIKFRAALDSCPVTYSCWPPLFITFLRTMRASSWGVTTTIDRYEPTIIRFLQKNQMALQ